MAASCEASVLALAELEPLPSLRTARLLALDRTGIAGQQAKVPKLAAIRLIERHERASDRQAQCPSLTRLPAAIDVRANVEPAERVRGRERLLNGRHQRGAREVV